MTMAAAAPLLAKMGGSADRHPSDREKDFEEVAAAYRAAGLQAKVVPFIDNMAAEYRAADLIVCRAGATTHCRSDCLRQAVYLYPVPPRG